MGARGNRQGLLRKEKGITMSKVSGLVDGNIHTVPSQGKEHFESKECWCEPTLEYKNEITGIEHWIHKGYEELEQ